MNYIKFNRYETMNSETMKELGSIIFDIEISDERSNNFNLINMLYGLYDGYFYSELIAEASTLEDKKLFRRICSLWRNLRTELLKNN